MGSTMTKGDSKKKEISDIAAAAAAATQQVGENRVSFQDLPPPTHPEAISSSFVHPGGPSGAFSTIRSHPTELVTARYFQDHFSLLVPSSSVRFRGSTREAFESHGCHVIENEDHQIILEERLHPQSSTLQGGVRRTIQIKRVRSTTKGLQLLRALYTIICVLFVGIFLAFAVQLILNIVLDLAIISGNTNQGSQTQWWNAPPLFLAMYQLCVTFSEGMVIATQFVIDAWSGHYLVKEFFPTPPGMRKNLVFVEWLFFAFLLGIPLLVMIGTLFAGVDNCWIITGVTWYASVGIFYVAFAGYTVFYEVRGAIHFVMSHAYPERRGSLIFKSDTFWEACKRCILMRLVRSYSGKKRATYFAKTIVDEDDDDIDDANPRSDRDKILGEDETDIVKGSYQERMSIWSKISMWPLLTNRLRLFHRLENPKKLYNINDAQGLRPFVTKWTWSLERVYCNPNSRRYVAIIDGPGAVTRNQVLSSLSCSILGTVLITLLIVSFLVWFGLTWWMVPFAVLLLVVAIYINIQRVRKTVSVIFRLNKQKKEFQADDKFTAWFVRASDECHAEDDSQPNDPEEPVEESKEEQSDQVTKPEEKEEPGKNSHRDFDRRTLLEKNDSTYVDGPSIGLYIVGKSMRVTEATEYVCWFMLFWEIALFYIWPVAVLFYLKTSYIAIVYLIGVGISGVRRYFNIVAVIEETGTMKLISGKSRSQSWLKQSRLTDIVDKISTDKSKRVWLTILGIFGFVFLVLFFSGLLGEQNGDTGDEVTLTYLAEWYYPPQRDNARYPSCVFGKPPSPSLENYTLADMAFLSSLSYRSTSVVQSQLQQWFGPSGLNVTDEFDLVNEWKLNDGGPESNSAVFRLFRFPGEDGATGIVSVRGTSSSLDLLVDNQLWQAAMLAQLVRMFLPFGEIFTPILPTLVYSINIMQSQAVQRVSYYKTVTRFVNNLKNDANFTGLALTGHSLGGGIAIISAAQTEVGAVAISGPNAMLSRLSFAPQLTVEQLNSRTFNVIPHRDWIPKFDDVAQNYQNIDCRSESRNPLSCHSIVRTICELMYTCGTNNRPALCECVTSFGYPMPLTDGDQDFEAMCANATPLS